MKVKSIMAPDGGINKNLPKNLINDSAWSDGNNIHFGVGYMEKVGGWQKFLRTPDARAASAAYSAGAYVVPTTPNDHVYKCTAAGITGSSTPVWPTIAGGTVTDGTVVWTEVGFNKLSGTLMAIDNYFKFNGDAYLLFLTTTKVYSYDPTENVAVDITGGTLNGTVDHPVFTENAQNYFVFTNGVDPVKYWTGTGNIANLPGMIDCVDVGASAGVNVTAAKSILYANNFLLLLGTVEDGTAYPQRVRWSQLGDIEKWKLETDLSGQAGWGDLTDGVDFGQCLRPLGEFVIAYKERSIVVLRYVGGDSVWNKYPAIQGTGLLAPRAMIDLGDEHIFVGPDNIYSFNGRDVAIAGDDIGRNFFRELYPAKSANIISAYLEEVPELWFVYTSTASSDGNPDKAIVYNTDTKKWSLRDMPMTGFGYYNAIDDPIWNTDEETWDSDNTEWNSSTSLANAPLNLCGDSQGYIYVLVGNSKDGADLDCFIRTKLFDFENPFLMKRAKRIQFMISREGPYNLQVKIGTAANVDEPISWSTAKYMSLAETSPPWVDFDITARYMMFEFATLLKDQPFKLTGYIVYYDTRGSV